MGRVISDLASLTETVADGDLLVCHNVSKNEGARDEKLTVEKLLTDALGNRSVTITSGGSVGIGTTTPGARLEVRTGDFVEDILSDVAIFRPTSAVASNTTLFVRQFRSPSTPYVALQAERTGTPATKRVIALNPDGGNVGIGTGTPGEELHVVGDVLITGLSGGGTRGVSVNNSGVLIPDASDARMKTDVEPIGAGDALGLVDALRPVRYRWGAEYAATRGEQVEVGLIAQEVLAHVPEVIGENEDEMLSVDYARLTALLIGAVQALAARVAALEGAAV